MTSGTKRTDSERTRVGVIYGGRSAEHSVSVESARALISRMDPEKYDVVPIGINFEGHWFIGTAPDQFVEMCVAPPLPGREVGKLEGRDSGSRMAAPEGTASPSTAISVTAVETPAETFLADRFPCQKSSSPLDVIFPLVHGTYGEDGTLQGLLEMAGIPFVGAAVLGSALCMDKWAQKLASLGAGIPTVPYIGFRKIEFEKHPDELMARIVSKLGFPVFVKPSNSGSSRGINKAKDLKSLRSAIEEAVTLDLRVVVEKGLNCREIEVAVLGNDEPRISCVGEILPQREWYDYEAKYAEGGMKLEIPAQIPDEVALRVRELAAEAFSLFDCSGLARIDFFLDRDSNELYLNEINTIPGFTAMSVYSKLWEASGIHYENLVEELIVLAVKRHMSRPQDYSVK